MLKIWIVINNAEKLKNNEALGVTVIIVNLVPHNVLQKYDLQ